MAEPLYSCMSKALIAEGDQLESGPRWIFSRRGTLRLYEERLTCGDWTIPYAEMRAAQLTHFRSLILRIPGYLLAVKTDTHTYHFGLNGWSYWKGELPFPVERREGRLRMSWFSIATRAVLVGYVAWLLWQRFR